MISYAKIAAQPWAAARIAAAPQGNPDGPTNSYVLDRLIVWHLNAPKFNNATEDTRMAQRSWTIEIRADFADAGKNEPIDHMVKKKAFELYTMLGMLEDNGQKPDIACWSEDFYHGRTELKLFAKEHVDASEAEQAMAADMEETPVSDELMAAAAEILHDKNNNK